MILLLVVLCHSSFPGESPPENVDVKKTSPDKMRYMPGSSVASARYHAVEAVDPDDLDDYEDEMELITENAATGRVQVSQGCQI